MAFKKIDDAARETGRDAGQSPTFTAGADPDAIEASAAAADAQSELDMGIEAEQHDAAGLTDQGVRVQRVMTMNTFYPSIDWIMTEIVGKGVGTHVSVGRLYGKANATERQTNDYKGKQLQSVVVSGMFEAVTLSTGEITRCSRIYLPMSFAEQIEMALRANPGALIDVDVDIGIEATGKSIPYTFTVTSYLEGQAERALRQMRMRRPTRLAIGATGGGSLLN